MPPIVRAGRRLLGALLVAGVPVSASAQTAAPRGPVQASVTTTTVFDDNVLGRATPTADAIVRVTPGLNLTLGRPHFRVAFGGSFDAEWYRMHQDLSTAQARQNGTLSVTYEASSRTTWSWTAGQSTTTNPMELNTLTALSIARQRASRWQGGSSVRHQLGRHSSVDLGYDVSRDALSAGNVTTTHTVNAQLTRQPTVHTDLFVHVTGRRFDFGAAGAAPAVNSTQATAGWSVHGKSAHLTAEGGVEAAGRAVRSTVEVSAGRKFSQTDVTGAYGRSTTTAFGVAGVIAVDHVRVGTVYQARPTMRTLAGHGPAGLRIAVNVGASRNQLPTGPTMSYQWSAEVARPLSRLLSVQIGYDGSTQQDALAALGAVGGDVRRNRVTFALSFFPWSPK